jgi:alcohol dehydrogenase class IV
MATFKTVNHLVSGSGGFSQLGELAKGLGRRALLVTGCSAMRRAGVTDRACSLLDEAGVDVRLFEEIGSEPTAAQCDAGRARVREEGCDLVIGLGGGSPMDAAKAIAALADADAPAAEYIAGRTADAPHPLPCIAIPTTSGTGAEVTPNAVVSDPDAGLKASIRGAGVLPVAALLDPELTHSCPPEVTAASGMDALTQAIESYVSIHATPLTEALSFDAARLLLGNLVAAYRDGNDAAAREACSYGSLMAGIALANARLGVVHGIAHPLGIRYHIPHGLCCAVLLPVSIRLNRAAAHHKYGRLSQAAGRDIAEAVDAMLDAMNLPRTLAAYSIPSEEFASIARESLPSGSLKANPKPVVAADIVAMLEQIAF